MTKMERFVERHGLPGAAHAGLGLMTGSAVTCYGSGCLSGCFYLLMTGNTVFMVYVHVRLGGTVIEPHEFEHKLLILFQMACAAVLFFLNAFGVHIMKELYGRHFLALRHCREIDHQNIRPHVMDVCVAVNVRDCEKHTRQNNGWKDALPPSKRSSFCHVFFLWFKFVISVDGQARGILRRRRKKSIPTNFIGLFPTIFIGFVK